ncbi:hypothetical protein ACFYU8_17760 [Brevibacillus sp. NPDC003359]|uniref:hypothetical protein n=1 Tax=unclassified Brevibacillus TaxID=2684853 RepID=UPI00367B645E
MYKTLLDKGFLRTIYVDQEDTPVFYTKKILDPILIEKLLALLEEIGEDDDTDYDGITGTIEITEDLKVAQYSFISNASDGFWKFGQVSHIPFEKILLAMPDEINRN